MPEIPERSRCVVVVEPDDDCRQSLGMLLETYGHAVHLARSGGEGLADAMVFHPDVVILDFALPDVPFAQIVLELQSIKKRPAIVAYSGHHGREAEALAAGSDVFVLKPSLETLMAVVRTIRPRVGAVGSRSA